MMHAGKNNSVKVSDGSHWFDFASKPRPLNISSFAHLQHCICWQSLAANFRKWLVSQFTYQHKNRAPFASVHSHRLADLFEQWEFKKKWQEKQKFGKLFAMSLGVCLKTARAGEFCDMRCKCVCKVFAPARVFALFLLFFVTGTRKKCEYFLDNKLLIWSLTIVHVFELRCNRSKKRYSLSWSKGQSRFLFHICYQNVEILLLSAFKAKPIWNSNKNSCCSEATPIYVRSNRCYIVLKRFITVSIRGLLRLILTMPN